MGILQMIVLAVLMLVAVAAGNIISHKMIQRAEERKAEKDMLSIMLQNMAANTSTTE